MPSKSIHVAANGRISFFFMAQYYSIVGMYVYVYVCVCVCVCVRARAINGDFMHMLYVRVNVS